MCDWKNKKCKKPSKIVTDEKAKNALLETITKYANEAEEVTTGLHTCYNESINWSYAEWIPKGQIYPVYYEIGISIAIIERNEKKNGLYNLRKEIMEALKNPHKLKNLCSEDDDMILLPEDIPKKR